MPQGLNFNQDSQALVASILIAPVPAATPLQLKQITGFNDAGAVRYVQLHDKESAPVNGDVPRYVMAVPAGQTYLWQPGQGGRRFYRGLWVALSTTPATLTAAAAAMWVEAQGITL